MRAGNTSEGPPNLGHTKNKPELRRPCHARNPCAGHPGTHTAEISGDARRVGVHRRRVHNRQGNACGPLEASARPALRMSQDATAPRRPSSCEPAAPGPQTTRVTCCGEHNLRTAFSRGRRGGLTAEPTPISVLSPESTHSSPSQEAMPLTAVWRLCV